MPSGPDHWHAFWKHDGAALEYLDSRGFTTPFGVITPPPGYVPGDPLDEAAIAYLCEEWDYGYRSTSVRAEEREAVAAAICRADGLNPYHDEAVASEARRPHWRRYTDDADAAIAALAPFRAAEIDRLRVEVERLKAALRAEDDYWRASRRADGSPRKGDYEALAAAEARRELARAALTP